MKSWQSGRDRAGHLAPYGDEVITQTVWTTPDAPPREVAILFVPDDLHRLEHLRAAGIPRLLLIPATATAPLPADELEDWVRVPADPDEVTARAQHLARAADGAACAFPAQRSDDREPANG